MKPASFLSGSLVFATSAALSLGAPVDVRDAVSRIKAEGLTKSQVMDVAATLTDVHGARLTGSPGARAAGEYARAKLQEWGMANARLEPWPFGPGWSNERFWIRLVTPQPFPLLAYPRAWTPSTNGAVKGEAILITGQTPLDLEKFRGKLRGKFVVVEADPERPADESLPARYGNADLAALAEPPLVAAVRPLRMSNERREFNLKRDELFVNEGALGAIEPSRFVRNGTVLVARSGARTPSDPALVPTIVMAIEHYGRIVRLLQLSVPVEIEMDAQNRVHTGTVDSFNVVAEIAGTDKKDDIVLLGAHLDSWHSGTGATDNAAGCAVMMEALRILKSTGLTLRRTVRVALWTGEEHGLLGSRAYVKDHIGDRTTMTLKPGHGAHTVYFNMDAGAGAIRGIYLQGNSAARPLFAEWLAPLAGLGATTVSTRDSTPGGSDHQSFDEIGVPGFQFIQDPGDYEDRTHTHHTNMDVYESLVGADLQKNAVIVAALAYQAANREEGVPRKALSAPVPRGGR